MSVRLAVARGRIHARRVMHDRIDVGQPTGEFVENEDGLLVPQLTVLHADLPAWIRPLHQQSRIVEVSGQPTTLLAYDVLVPHATEGLEIDQVVRVRSTAGTDLTGRSLTIIDVTWGTHQVARRLVCRAQL